MAKFEVGNGVADYVKSLEDLAGATNSMIGQSIYVGAGLAFDAIKGAIDSIPSRDYGSRHMQVGITDIQRQGLRDSLGIAKMRIDGTYHNVKIGFDGYNDKQTSKYPQGQPNAMIARIVESGSEYHRKTPFIDNTMRANKETIEQTMAQKFDQLCAEKIGGQ